LSLWRLARMRDVPWGERRRKATVLLRTLQAFLTY
jgi:hypothetical protein